MMPNNKWLDGVMGLVVGDALGDPVQFMPRAMVKQHPVRGMRDCLTHKTPAGTWTDDSALTMATLCSLVERDGVDLEDIMSRFVEWLHHGMFTPFGYAFDIGATCGYAIDHFAVHRNVATCGRTGERANGNGALMRILPICLLCKDQPDQTALDHVHRVTALTHNHIRAHIGSGIYFFLVQSIVEGGLGLRALLQRGMNRAVSYYGDPDVPGAYNTEIDKYSRLFSIPGLMSIQENGIASSGYVVDTLEAAVWALATTDSYEKCVLKAVNLGGDADSIGAVAGGLAGLYYGYDAIPERWKKQIKRRDWIESRCEAMDEKE